MAWPPRLARHGPTAWPPRLARHGAGARVPRPSRYRAGPRPLAGPELAVAGDAEAGHEVADLVEVPVERRDVDRHVRVRRAQPDDARRRGDDADELDAVGAPAVQDVDRRDGRAAGREHRVEHQTDVDRGR